MGKIKIKNEDMIGKKYGRLTILDVYHVKKGKYNRLFCRVQCDCENKTIKEINKSSIINGYTQSCGCYGIERAIEVNYIHGHGNSRNSKRTPTYRCWSAMLQRCNNPNNKDYHHYGGRGITVDKSWNEFINFLNDMGERPSAKHSIDRIDVNKGYSKDNCKWSLFERQIVNRRMQKSNTSGVEGVQWNKQNKNYRALITILGKRISLGSYKTIEEATIARRKGEELREKILKEKGI